MKTHLILLPLLAMAATAPAEEVTPDFHAKTTYQTHQDWLNCLSSSHADVLEDAVRESARLGTDVAGIARIEKIVVSVPQPEMVGTRLPEKSIHAAIHDYVLGLPKPILKSTESDIERWIDVTGSEKQEYRIIFINDVPSELYLRKDPNTLIRFSLKKK